MTNKQASINLDIDSERLKQLIALAHKKQTSVQDLVETILVSYLDNEQSSAYTPETEKRRHDRKKVTIPAVMELVISDKELQCLPAKIMDMSLGGMMIQLYINDSSQAEMIKNVDRFKVMFNIPGSDSPMNVECSPKRVISTDSLGVGASFLPIDNKYYDAIEHYLM